MGGSLCSLSVPSGFDGRGGSEVSTGHIFPQDVLAAITLVGDGAGVGVARARARCEPGLLLCSVVVTTLSRAGSGPKVLEWKPSGSGQADSFPS